MSGRTEGLQYAIIAVAFLAIFTDLIWKKIFNWLTIPTIIGGVVYLGYLDGVSGAGHSLLGVLAGLLIFGWMFWLGFMGGGDVKLLMAFGALGGVRYVEEVALLSILLGGVISIGILIFKGRFVDFVSRMVAFLMSVFIREMEVQFPKLDSSLKMPFGVSLAIAAIWVSQTHPLERMGIPLWP